jgi:TonB family protein
MRRSAFFLFVFALSITASALGFPVQQREQQQLKAIQKVDPEYPEEARAAGVDGKVVVEVTIEETGEVSKAKVISGHRLLQQAAVDAVKQWRFSNPLKSQAVVQLTIVFSLEDQPAPPQPEKSTLKNTHKVDAVYPEEAKRKDVQGEVAVEITVNGKGEVTEARAVNGDTLLRKAAVDAAKQFRFTNSLNTTVVATLTFNFVL